MMDRRYMVLLGLGFELAVLVLSLIYVGKLVDEQQHWSGIGVATGAILALVVWTIHLIYAVKAIESQEEKQRNEKDSQS